MVIHATELSKHWHELWSAAIREPPTRETAAITVDNLLAQLLGATVRLAEPAATR